MSYSTDHTLSQGSILGFFKLGPQFTIIICRHYNKIIPAWCNEKHLDDYGYVVARRTDLDFKTLRYFQYISKYDPIEQVITE